MKSILACVDGTSTTEGILAHTASVAEGFRVAPRIIRVVEGDPGSDGMDPVQTRLSRVEADAFLRSCVSFLHRRGISAEAEVAEGDPAEVIVSDTERRGVDLLVIGRGRSSLSNRGLGLNVSSIAERTAASVLVAPLRPARDPSEPLACVLAAVDGSPCSEWAAFHAAALAQAHGARLLLIHVVVEPQLLDPFGGGSLADLATELVRKSRAVGTRYLDQLRARLSLTGTNVDVGVPSGPNAIRILQELAKREAADLLVIGASGWWADRAGDVRGSVAEGLLRSWDVPVLICRPRRAMRRSTQPPPSFPRSVRTRYARTR